MQSFFCHFASGCQMLKHILCRNWEKTAYVWCILLMLCDCVNVIPQEALEIFLNACLGMKMIWALELKGLRSGFS